MQVENTICSSTNTRNISNACVLSKRCWKSQERQHGRHHELKAEIVISKKTKWNNTVCCRELKWTKGCGWLDEVVVEVRRVGGAWKYRDANEMVPGNLSSIQIWIYDGKIDACCSIQHQLFRKYWMRNCDCAVRINNNNCRYCSLTCEHFGLVRVCYCVIEFERGKSEKAKKLRANERLNEALLR